MDDEAEKLAETLRWIDRQLAEHGYPEPSPIRRRIRSSLIDYNISVCKLQNIEVRRGGSVSW